MTKMPKILCFSKKKLSINNEKYSKYTAHARADKNDRSSCILLK